jgi:hypothetical protein
MANGTERLEGIRLGRTLIAAQCSPYCGELPRIVLIPPPH